MRCIVIPKYFLTHDQFQDTLVKLYDFFKRTIRDNVPVPLEIVCEVESTFFDTKSFVCRFKTTNIFGIQY
eukprot:TRINITY_DN6864_c0_g1_i1.p1 TRINITY_DN6864_c0_g1~~TRINITY_DN6864_c0_g1_i1.p1  ORF type:complete len:82 (-),score=15.14 TRINITY_DN6864_c0_g1_i1:123-332(-)